MIENLDKELLKLIIPALDSDDEDEQCFAEDLILKALEYTGYRLKDNRKEKTDGKARSTCHNAYMDAVNIFLRYEKTNMNKETPDLDEVKAMDRRDLGDAANRIVCELAIRQR